MVQPSSIHLLDVEKKIMFMLLELTLTFIPSLTLCKGLSCLTKKTKQYPVGCFEEKQHQLYNQSQTWPK